MLFLFIFMFLFILSVLFCFVCMHVCRLLCSYLYGFIIYDFICCYLCLYLLHYCRLTKGFFTIGVWTHTVYYWRSTGGYFAIGVSQRESSLLASDKGFLHFWPRTSFKMTLYYRRAEGPSKGTRQAWAVAPRLIDCRLITFVYFSLNTQRPSCCAVPTPKATRRRPLFASPTYIQIIYIYIYICMYIYIYI